MSHLPVDLFDGFIKRFNREKKLATRRRNQKEDVNSALRESRSVRFLWAGCVLIVLVWAAYFIRFWPLLSPTWLPVTRIPIDSDAMPAWGQFGDFLGGVLNPLLSFLALLAVVKNLRLQAAQLAQAQADRLPMEIANRMSALASALDVLTGSINQDLDVHSKNGPINPKKLRSKMAKRDEISAELLRLAQQLLEDE